VITGANGYIGRRLAEMAIADARAVTALGRSSGPGGDAHREAGARPRISVLESRLGRTAIIHLAHDWYDRDVTGVNQRGTATLLASARLSGVQRFVVASSVSARADAVNAYGRIKWTIEQGLEGVDAVAARIGLVYGGAERGMYGLLLKLVSAMPILPMVEPSRLVHPIHVDEVCRALLALADSDVTGCKVVAAPAPIPFAQFLKTLAREGFAASLIVLSRNFTPSIAGKPQKG